MNDLKKVIYDLLSNSSQLSNLIGDNIFYNILPQNHKNTEDSVVFALLTTDTIRDLQGAILYKDKACNIKINSITQENIYNILDVIEELISECETFKTESGEVDDEPFWDETSQWFTLNFDFQINDF